MRQNGREEEEEEEAVPSGARQTTSNVLAGARFCTLLDRLSPGAWLRCGLLAIDYSTNLHDALDPFQEIGRASHRMDEREISLGERGLVWRGICMCSILVNGRVDSVAIALVVCFLRQTAPIPRASLSSINWCNTHYIRWLSYRHHIAVVVWRGCWVQLVAVLMSIATFGKHRTAPLDIIGRSPLRPLRTLLGGGGSSGFDV